MITKEIEKGMVKCDEYWPVKIGQKNQKEFKGLFVELQEIHALSGDLVERTIVLKV